MENYFTKPIKYWVPSIAVSALVIYQGNNFKDWNGDALTRFFKRSIIKKIEFKNGNLISEKIIFKGDIGRIRDVKIQKKLVKYSCYQTMVNFENV